MGMSLDDISSSTKVSIRYLRALEQNDFGQLPGGIINKGIVRSYVTQLGLDQDQWLGYFLSAWRESGAIGDEEAGWITFAENVSQNRISRRRGTGIRWLGVMLMIAVVAAAGVGIWLYVNNNFPWHL